MEPSRVLIVGYGSIGARHLRVARKILPDAEIMVHRHKTSTEVPELANFISCSLNDVRGFNPEVAIIANPASMHVSLAMALLDFGAHVLIEKPIAASTFGVDQLIDKADKLGRVCQVGYNLRFSESLSVFRKMILNGEIGYPFAARIEVGQSLPNWRLGQDYRNTVSAQRKLGGGVLLELSHEIDSLRWIFGEAEWVSGWYGNVSALEIDVEDTAHLTIGYKSEKWVSPVVASVVMDFVRHDTTRCYVVIGSKGSIRWDGVTNKVDIYKTGGKSWQNIYSGIESQDATYSAQFVHFLECVRNGTRPLVSGQDGLAVLKIVEAARKAKIRLFMNK